MLRSAPRQFDRKKDAADWLDLKRSEVLRGEWIDPDAGKVTLAEYGRRWIAERKLAETTRERYGYAFDKHVIPVLGGRELAEINTAHIRSWRKDREDHEAGQASIAKAYRLMHAIFETAVDDQLIRRNPCRIAGAGEDGSAERTALTVDEVFALADAVPRRWRALVLLAAFSSLRFGELAALQRKHLDAEQLAVAVRQSQAELGGGRQFIKPPKSAAGMRDVAVPDVIAAELQHHLDTYAQPGPDGFVFVGNQGGRLRRSNFRRVWQAAVQNAKISTTGVHFHDLRHTGNDLAARSGASTRELMTRMGHSSMRAALIYQHATSERDRTIADTISRTVRSSRAGTQPDTEGHAGGTDEDEAAE